MKLMKCFKALAMLMLVFFMLGINKTADSTDMTKTDDREFKIAIIYTRTLNDYLAGKPEKDKIPYIRKIAPKANIRSFFMNADVNVSPNILQDKAKKLDKKIAEFNPDLIVMYEDIAVEFYAIPYIYNKGNPNSFFMCLSDHEWKRMVATYKLDDPKFKNLIKGSLTSDNISFLADIVMNVNPQFKQVHLIMDAEDEHGDDEYLQAELKETFKGKELLVYKAANNKELRLLLDDLNKKETGILISSINHLKDYSTGKGVATKDMASIFKVHNSKHVEVTVSCNLSKYGFALSYLNCANREGNISDGASCNTTIRRFYNREDVKGFVEIESSTLLVSKNRVKALGITNIYEVSKKIPMILLED